MTGRSTGQNKSICRRSLRFLCLLFVLLLTDRRIGFFFGEFFLPIIFIPVICPVKSRSFQNMTNGMDYPVNRPAAFRAPLPGRVRYLLVDLEFMLAFFTSVMVRRHHCSFFFARMIIPPIKGLKILLISLSGLACARVVVISRV